MAPKLVRSSLSRKILGLVLLNLLLIAIVLALFAEWQFGLSVESLLLGPTRDRILAIANSLGTDLEATPHQDRDALLRTYARAYDVEFHLVDPRGQSLTASRVELPAALLDRMRIAGPRPDQWQDRAEAGRPSDRGAPRMGPPPRDGPDKIFLAITAAPRSYWVGVRMPTTGPRGERGVPAVLLLRAGSIFNSKLFLDWRSLLLLAAALAAVALLCWWPFVHRITRSIREMDLATERIAQGLFDRHVSHDRADELGHLGEQINHTAVRLESFVKNQKRFLGDVAHELCAPIARIQFALGILEQRVAETQQQHLAALRDEIQEMSGLVNELLMFSKSGMQGAETPLRHVTVGAVVERAVGQQVPGAGTIEVALVPQLAVVADESFLLRALTNLLRNALRYAGGAGPITVTARREGARVLLTVADCGPGLPEESLEEIFTPFYRPEVARSRETGGVGLGLAIVKSCIEACRGTVACRNRKPSGLEVTISLAAVES
jgi:two-component system sensor histidine kinase CpxA